MFIQIQSDPLNWSTKFSSVLASYSLEILVLQTEWLLRFFECLHSLLLFSFPSGAFMCHTSLLSQWLPCLTAKKNGESGWFISSGRWLLKRLVQFDGTSFCTGRVNHLWLEWLLVAIFLPLAYLHLTFIQPFIGPDLAAILHLPITNCSFCLWLKPKWRDKNNHMVLCRASGLEEPNWPILKT